MEHACVPIQRQEMAPCVFDPSAQDPLLCYSLNLYRDAALKFDIDRSIMASDTEDHMLPQSC